MARLAAIDLDGTLLRDDGTLSERSCAALQSAREAGIEVVLVSARGPRGVTEVARAAELAGPAIGSNGAVVLDLATGRIERFRPLATDVAVRLVHALRERLPGIRFAVERETFGHEPGFAAWDWTPPPGTRVADAVELLADPAAKLILRHERHELEVIAATAREIAGDTASISIAGAWVVEVTAAGVNKAAALVELCEEFSIGAEDVVAFGDMPNDIPMLTWAGRAVAVANAHPDVLAIAGEVTASNEEDGVAVVLERLASDRPLGQARQSTAHD